METESSVEVLGQPSVKPAAKIINDEGVTVDNGNTVADAEENISQGSSKSESINQLLLSKSGNTTTDKSNGNISGAANASKEKQQSKPKSRVVQSRFRTGLSNSKNNNSNSRSGLTGNDSSHSKNNLNCTSGLTSLPDTTTRKKVLRGSSSQRPGVGKSLNNITRTTENAMRSTVNVTSKPRPAKSAFNLNESRLNGRSPMKSKSSASGSSKLHSTVLAEKTMLGSTQNIFSTTLVGGVEPGKANLIGPKGCDITNSAIRELPELPDISAIRLDSSSGEKNEVTILSTGEKDSSEDTSIGSSKEVTFEDLAKEYLRYLQAAYIDVVTEEAFDKQLEDLKTQLVFLDKHI
ncbi:protein rtoA-like [Macrobrachium rosenbergii]|uniref:protein rtoA-like n=1 Tax=Macrobrachium rosenbergii TaxID=79674 RepID=UPI0034D54465